MRKLYVKLAAVNICNNRQLYLPYLLAGVFSAAMFYLVMSIQDNPGLEQMRGGANVAVTLLLGVIIVGLFAAIFLFYTNSFIMKRRKRELSVYNILGMEKKHIARVLFLEMLFTAAVTIGGGLLFGIAFGKLMTMLLYRMTGFNQSVPFTVSLTGCHHTLVLFGCIYAVTLFYNFMQIKLSNPMELLHSANAGEREPKTKVLLAVIGAAALGGGYYLALTVADAVSAITMFFVAVLLVILGTYCLFTAGSIAVLKLLRKNKNYYYKSRHFTTVSGMIYRMKQNAVGLANICILSTMVLVTVSTTLCMYLGVEDALKRRFVHEVSVVSYYNAMPEHPEEVDALAEASLKDSGRVLTGHSAMLNMSLTAVRTDDGFSVTGIGAGTDYSINDVVLLTILPKSDWENYTGETVGELERGEIALASSSSYEKGTLALDNEIYQVKQICAYPEAERDYLDDMADDSVFMIVPDRETLGQIFTELKQNWDEERVSLQIKYNMAFDIDGTAEEKVAAENALHSVISSYNDGHPSDDTKDSYSRTYVECRAQNRDEYYSLNGGLLFIGLFLGAMFLMVTVLIIFYKQISEGYEDKERYAIMEKVGMSNAEVKRSIRTQILTVFFLPIGAAVLHVVMAFPMIKWILAAFSLNNTALFALCVAATALVFLLIYLLVFALTSRSYYKIVGNQV